MTSLPYRAIQQVSGTWSLTLIMVISFFSQTLCSAQRFGFDPHAKVQAETRIDWGYAVTGKSTAEPLVDESYHSKRQKYVLYGPTNVANGRTYPLILYIPVPNTSYGWDYCRATCIRHGVIFAEPLKAGNRVPIRKRVRIVLDVLDDVRRRFPIDPDRTYVMGFSGGGQTADLILKALPEYFGGALLSSGHSPISQQPWQVQRFKERLSFSMHAGRREKTLALELEHVSGPIYRDLGIRSQFVIHEGIGHAMVPPVTVEQAYRWLEAGLPKRREMAELFPTTRINGNPTQQESAAAWLNEAKKRLATPEQIVAGLEQLNATAKRWPYLAEGQEAKALFDDYQSRDPRPWVAEAKLARLNLTEQLAKRYEHLATGNIGASSVRRSGFARGALMNWNIILQESENTEQIDRAKEKIDVLKKIEENDPTRKTQRRNNQ